MGVGVSVVASERCESCHHQCCGWRCRWWREVATDTAVARRSPKVKLWYCLSYASLWGCCSLCHWWGGCTASWFCICLLSMLQLALLRLRFLSIASQFHTVMDMLLTKSKTRRPIIVCWGVNFNDSYYDPRIRVFVIFLSFSVKCLDPSLAVDGTKYLMTSLNYKGYNPNVLRSRIISAKTWCKNSCKICFMPHRTQGNRQDQHIYAKRKFWRECPLIAL